MTSFLFLSLVNGMVNYIRRQYVFEQRQLLFLIS